MHKVTIYTGTKEGELIVKGDAYINPDNIIFIEKVKFCVDDMRMQTASYETKSIIGDAIEKGIYAIGCGSAVMWVSKQDAMKFVGDLK